MLSLFKRKTKEPVRVDIVNFPVTRKVVPFCFLGYDFAPDKIVAVTAVVAENTSPKAAEPSVRYVFRVVLAEKVMIAFHEKDEETTKKKRELFIQAWHTAL